MANRYRKRGLDRAARRMVEFLEEHGLEGSTVLDVGGGVGEIEIELLKLGAAHAVNLELCSAYDTEAAQLLSEAGLEQRVERCVHDIAVDPAGVEAADVVVLHRVVCCYPDYERLLGAAAEHARRLLVFSHPPRNMVSRLLFTCQNSSSGCDVWNSGRSPIRLQRCSLSSRSAGCGTRSPTAGWCGTWPGSNASSQQQTRAQPFRSPEAHAGDLTPKLFKR
jgi:hypothetical protein